MEQDNLRLFPNLRWLPSRSVKTRVAHQVFYNRVWAKTDPFWQSNTPGTEWECKCSVEETDEGATNNEKIPEVKPPAGLEGNPAFTGEVFTDNATYIKNNKSFQVDEKTSKTFGNLKQLVSNDSKKWRFDYYTDNEGTLITNRNRIEERKISNEKLEIFEKEHKMCLVLAQNGHSVIYRETVTGSFDIYLNNKPAELKKTRGTRNIEKFAKKAINKQSAELVVFEFEKFDSKFIEELKKLPKKGIHGYYYVTGESKLREF
jgi:hypothetical protein